MRRLKFAAPAAAVLAAAFIGGAQAASDPTGVWLNDTGRGAIEIKPCGNGLCGHVVWVKDGADSKGCGKQIIGNVKSAGAGRWDNGWIYSPEKRRNYDVELRPLDNGTLRVTGYAGVKFLSKTMIWTRAPADLQRCGTVEAKATPPAPATAPTPEATKPSAPPAAASASETAAPPTPPSASNKEQPAAAAPAEASPPPAPDNQTAANEAEKSGPDSADEGLDLNDLKLDKFFKRTAEGKCKLDLPWVKVKFDCDRQ
jgi:uncharacterized protein (DUF2147 family)